MPSPIAGPLWPGEVSGRPGDWSRSRRRRRRAVGGVPAPPTETPDAGGASRWPAPAAAFVLERSDKLLLLHRDAEITLDVGHDALVDVEVLRRDGVPAAQVLDGEQARRDRDLLPGGVRALHDGAVAVLGEDLLGLGGVHEVEEGLGLLRVLAVGGD